MPAVYFFYWSHAFPRVGCVARGCPGPHVDYSSSDVTLVLEPCGLNLNLESPCRFPALTSSLAAERCSQCNKCAIDSIELPERIN